MQKRPWSENRAGRGENRTLEHRVQELRTYDLEAAVEAPKKTAQNNQSSQELDGLRRRLRALEQQLALQQDQLDTALQTIGDQEAQITQLQTTLTRHDNAYMDLDALVRQVFQRLNQVVRENEKRMGLQPHWLSELQLQLQKLTQNYDVLQMKCEVFDSQLRRILELNPQDYEALLYQAQQNDTIIARLEENIMKSQDQIAASLKEGTISERLFKENTTKLLDEIARVHQYIERIGK